MMLRSLVALSLVGFSTVLTSGCAAQSKATSTTKPYMLTTCVVSDEALDSMGGPISYMHNGQEIKFCCGSCETAFKKDPEKYLGKLQAGKGAATKPADAH
jgi:hypothetical protein